MIVWAADVQEIFGILRAELLCPTPALCGWVGVDGGRGYSVRKQRSGNETPRENQPTDAVTAELRDQISLVYTESLF